jgi:hypothetical protein
MKKVKNVFFGAFSVPHSEPWQKNTKIIYDKNCIEFISNRGDKFNLKFKNSIEEVYEINDGILVKFGNISENFEFFHVKNKNEINDSYSSKFMYYLIPHHPLNNISGLNILTNENISNINIIKSSSKFPFLIAKTQDNVYQFYLLMKKEERKSDDFDNYLQKIMYNSVDQCVDNFNISNSDSKYYLMFLYDVKVDRDEKNKLLYKDCDVKIFTDFIDKKAVMFSLYDKVKRKLCLVKFKFKSNDTFSFVKTIKTYSGVLNYQLIDNLISCYHHEELFERSSKANKNMVVNFLNKKRFFGIKNKTVCFLDEENYLNYTEGLDVIMRINVNNLLGGGIYISDFKIEKNFAYSFFNKEINSDHDEDGAQKVYKFNLDYALNSKHIVVFLKYFKCILKNINNENRENLDYDYEKIYLILIKNFFEFSNFNKNSSFTSGDRKKILWFLDYIMLIFSHVYNYNTNSSESNETLHDLDCSINNDEFIFDNLVLLFQNNLENKNKCQFKNKNCAFFTTLPSQNQKEFLNKEIIDFFKIYKELIVNLLVNFSLKYFENLKIQNYYLNESNCFLHFAFKLLEISNRKDTLISHARVFSLNYSEIIKMDYFDTEVYNYNISEYQTFLDYLKELLRLDNGSKINCTPKSNIFFNFTKDIILILGIIKSHILPNELIHLNNREIFMSQEYNLFLKKISEPKQVHQNNILSSLINAGLDINKIKSLHPYFSLKILESINKYKSNPYPVITSDKYINTKILSLVDRVDLAKIFGLGEAQDSLEAGNNIQNNLNLNISGLLYENQSSNYQSDYYMTNIKFNEDTRFKEGLRILNPSRVVKVNTSPLSNFADTSRLEIEKFNLMLKYLLRQYSSTLGNGAINLNTIKTFPKDILNIKPLNLNCISSTDEMTFKLDLNSDLVKDKEFMRWPEFHNGVSHALKLSTEYFTNKSYIRNWILFNKPGAASYEHGGFLLGLGLLKQLDSLYSTDIYQYMKTAHDGITIGILLGRATSKISTMEESLSRTLCLHISYLIPSSLELSIPITTQCAASVGLGLLYLGTGNRLMTEMLLNQIGRKFSAEKNMNINYLENYNLCLGFSIGLINLCMGKMNINEDLKLEEKLLNFANGGRKIELINKNLHDDMSNSNSNFNFNNYTNLFPTKKFSQTYVEEFEVNLKITAAAAYACLSLIYLKSGNTQLANKIKIPTNLYQLENFRPFNLYLAILTKNLIQWDNIEDSESWILTQIPEFIKFLHEEKLSTIEENIIYSSKINIIEFSQISTSYYYAIAAGVMSLGFKHLGSNNKEISKIVINIINRLRKLKVVSEIIVREQRKYDDLNKFYINKNTLEHVLCICSYSLSMIMAGSGDLDTFKILRILRKKMESDIKNFNYGYNQAIHHAIGMLFLGAGALTFSQDKQSLAFLYISTFPLFSNSAGCNEKYLQALRHLYVLSCENKIVETRDIDTGYVVRTKLEVELHDNSKLELITPVNIEDYSKIKIIKVKSDNHYYVQVNMDNFNKCDMSNMKTKTIFIKRKTHFDEKINEIAKIIPLISRNSEYDCLIVNNLIRDLVERIKTYVEKLKAEKLSSSRSDHCINLQVATENILDIWDYKLMRHNIHTNLSKIRIYSLLLSILYLKNDELISLLIINNMLLKLIRIIEPDEIDYDVFRFFFDLSNSINSLNDEKRELR